MINAYIKHNDTTTSIQSLDHSSAPKPGSSEFIWIDIVTNILTPEIASLLESYGCHPLAIKDAFRTRHPPKLERFENHAFILYRGIHRIESTLTYHHQQIGIFAGKDFLITTHPAESLGINKTLEDHVLEKTPCTGFSIALHIMHQSSGIYLEQALLFEDELSDREDSLYSRSGEKSLTELSAFRASLIKLRRTFDYHRNVSLQLKQLGSRLEYLNFEDSEHLVNDLNDRFDRLYTLTKMHYEICGEIIDGYISITSHQLNITMRVLTVITATFVPLSFLAGIYGMNFEYIPELHYRNSYFILLASMGAIALSLLAVFKYKKWF